MAQRAQETGEPIAAEAVPSSAYTWYVAGGAAWYGAFGMQGVIFAWLVAMELRASADWVGIAQSCSMIPSFLLILVGGAVADRHDRRALLIGYHCVAAGLAALLLTIVATGALTLALLIGYALALGTLTAFALPARDSLLSEVVAGRDMMRAVTGMTLVQFGAQAAGAAIVGGARWIGIVPAISIYGGLLLLGVPTLLRLRPAPPHGTSSLHLSDLGRGLREVLASPVLRGVWVLITAVGLLFVGPFMVVFPLLVRDYYGGDVGQLGMLSMSFPIGTILGSLAIRRACEIRRKGVAQLLSLLWGALCLGSIGLGLPFWGALIAVCCFGMGAAVMMNTGRTVFQERATPANRARVLSTFSLGMMGASGLLGAPLSGFLVAQIGPLWTCIAMASGMVVVVSVVSLVSDVASVE
jgi:MFS family permease